MDALIVLLMIAWVFSAISRFAKKSGQSQHHPGAPLPGRGNTPVSRGAERDAPMRPASLDLPGQTTMPIELAEGFSMEQSQSLEDQAAREEEALRAHRRHASERTERLRGASAQQGEQTAGAVIPGLRLTFTGESLVQGVVFSEILNRKAHRRLH